jgi:hypothetical protein
MTEANVRLLMQIMGLVFMGTGLAARLGIWRGWYWRTRGTVYSYMPVGIAFLIFSVLEIVRQRFPVYYLPYQVLGAFVFAVGVFWTLRPPAFVKPPWVRWVEVHPKRVKNAMSEAVRHEQDWTRHIESQEAVNSWAKALERKLPRPKKG